jgi:hypothetical protein
MDIIWMIFGPYLGIGVQMAKMEYPKGCLSTFAVDFIWKSAIGI